MEVFLIILAYIFAIVGILGAFFPIIPAVLFSYGSLLLFYFATDNKMSLMFLLVWAVVVALASVIDSVLPPYITKRFGGSKKATWGSFWGVLIGSFFIPPFGMVIGSFTGALIGEYIEERRLDDKAFRVAMGSFLGFILGTGLKLMISIMILIALIIKSI